MPASHCGAVLTRKIIKELLGDLQHLPLLVGRFLRKSLCKNLRKGKKKVFNFLVILIREPLLHEPSDGITIFQNQVETFQRIPTRPSPFSWIVAFTVEKTSGCGGIAKKVRRFLQSPTLPLFPIQGEGRAREDTLDSLCDMKQKKSTAD